MTSGSTALTTKDTILTTALEVFAEKGYRSATVREISSAAGVNLAAINYHFGNKASLYLEVLRFAYSRSSTDEPMPVIEQSPSDPERALRAWIAWYLRRILAHRDTTIGRLMFREMADPTPALASLAERGVKPIYAGLESIVAAMLPAHTDAITLKLHCLSVIGQCLLYRTGAPMLDRLDPPHLRDEHGDRIIEHVADAAVAMVRSVSDAKARAT